MNLSVTPLNEGQELNYSEKFTGTIDALLERCSLIQKGLQLLLPKGEFTILLTNWEDEGKEFTFDGGKLFERNGDEITINKLKYIN